MTIDLTVLNLWLLLSILVLAVLLGAAVVGTIDLIKQRDFAGAFIFQLIGVAVLVTCVVVLGSEVIS